MPKNGVVNVGILHLNPTDNFIVDFQKFIPIDCVILFLFGCCFTVINAVSNSLNLAVKLGISQAEVNHIVEQQRKCRKKHEKRNNYNAFSCNFL